MFYLGGDVGKARGPEGPRGVSGAVWTLSHFWARDCSLQEWPVSKQTEVTTENPLGCY